MDYKTAKYISDIKTKAHLCRINCKFDQCPAFKSCPQLPFQMDKADMRKKSRIFFVFEGGSQDDSTYGFPAVSNQGVYFRMRFLTPFLAETGDVPYMITNLVRNALVDAGGAPRSALGDEFLYCWDHFYGELMKHKPEVLVCFGNTAFGQLYRRAKNKNELPPADSHGVGKLRGKPVTMELASDYSPLVFTTYAPGYLLKTPAAAKFYSITTAAGKLEVGEDLARVVEYFCPHKKSEKTMIEVKKVELLDTVDKAVGFIDYLTRGLPKNEYFDLAFDTETDNLNKVHNNRFLSWQFSYRQGEAFFIPIDHPERPVFARMEDKARLITAFQKLLDSSTAETRIRWILMHNAKFDLGVLYGLFKILPRGMIPVWDTQLAMHWLDENRKSMSALLDGSPYSLKTLGKEFFVNTKNEPFTYSSEQLAARSEGELVNLAFEDLVEYGGTDTILTWQLKQEQMKMAKKQPSHALPKLERFMKYYFSPASRAVALMECNGLYVSRPQIKYLQGTESPIWNRLDQIENIELQNRPEVLVFREKFRKIIEGESKVSYADIWDDNTDGDLPHFNPNKKDQETPFYLEFLNLTPLKVSKKTDQASLDADFLKHYSDRSVYTNLPELTSYKDFYTVPCGHNDDGDPLFEKNPLQLILEYRALKKLGSTYTTGIEKMVVAPKGDAIDGRIRGNFWLGGTDTGRLSSSDPNMQNLPSGKTALAKEVKNMFQAEPPSRKFPKGTVLIQLDYKTAEVRWAAIFANDKNLIRIFNEAREALMKAFDPTSEMSDEDFSRTQLESDLHRRTASLMYGIPPEKVGKEQRQASKSITFGMLYGMGVDTLAADHGWDKDDAQDKMDKFFSAFPSMKKWLDNIPEKARKDGYVETIMGRRRRLWDMFASNDFRNAARANRLAMNSSIQGQSSDAGMIGVFSFLQYLLDNRLERRWLIENVVHDSCLIQVPMEDIEKALPIIQHHFVIGMQDYIAKYFNFTLPLPIECEIEIGLKYGDLEKWDGRPATLPKIIGKIQGKAEVLWAKKKETDGRKPSPAWDLVS